MDSNCRICGKPLGPASLRGKSIDGPVYLCHCPVYGYPHQTKGMNNPFRYNPGAVIEGEYEDITNKKYLEQGHTYVEK